MYDDEEVALMPREGSFNEVELGEFGGETLTEEVCLVFYHFYL